MSGLVSILGGLSIALFVGLIPTMLLSFLPEKRIRYLGGKDSLPDRTVSSVIAYIAGGP